MRTECFHQVRRDALEGLASEQGDIDHGSGWTSHANHHSVGTPSTAHSAPSWIRARHGSFSLSLLVLNLVVSLPKLNEKRDKVCRVCALFIVERDLGERDPFIAIDDKTAPAWD